MKNSHKTKIPKPSAMILFSVFIVVANVVAIYFFGIKNNSVQSCGGYSFINPRFACGYKNIVDKKGYVEFKFRLNNYIEDKKREGKAEIVGIWFRDLESGPTFGINDRADFIPASLLKLPLVVTFLNFAEDEPNILRHAIFYSKLDADVLNQTFLPTGGIKNGKDYTIDELIYNTMVYSDNYSYELLYEYLIKSFGYDILAQTYRDLGILDPKTDSNFSAVNVKGYGSIFRLLYNTSFLNKEMSEKLLSLMAQSDFRKGLTAGVPENIKIAHKFGERFLADGSKQLHDCGIIYYPDNPYQLCVMTKGTNFDDLADIISHISTMTYEEFNSRRLSD